jgi:HPt (histidine-containing phosphotransfer) domain-containing protein
MDGFEATEIIITEDNMCSNTPIIAMTASADRSTRLRCLEIGMAEVITKPIDKRTFINTIEDIIHQYKSNADKMDKKIEDDNKIYEQAQSNESSSRSTNSESNLLDVAEMVVDIDDTNDSSKSHLPFDYDEYLDEIGEHDLLVMIVQKFIENLEKQIPMIQHAIEKNDFETLRHESHSIKGGAATLTAMPLSVAAKKLEMHGKNKDSKDVADSFDNFIARFDDFKNFVTESVLSR